MTSERMHSDDDQFPAAGFIDRAVSDLNMAPGDPAVIKYAELLSRLSEKENENLDLREQLKVAQTDPITGLWLRGPGFQRVEALMSAVENNLAGLIEDEDAPNVVLAVGLDVEGLHYTNNWYSQEAGDKRLSQAGQELRETADIIKSSTRTKERRTDRREGEHPRLKDVLIRTGGDEFMAALPVRETEENTREMIAGQIAERLSRRKDENAPNIRIMYRIGFFVPGVGQSAEDLYHSVEPKAALTRRHRLARPIFKIVRLGLGHYKPPMTGKL